MAQKKSINNEIFEVMLRGALITKYQNETDDALKNAEEHEYSDKFKKEIIKIRKSINKTQNINTAFKVLGKTFVSAAAVIGIISCVLLTQPDVYAAVQKVFRNVFEDHDRYSYQGEENKFQFDKNRSLGYVPNGYELSSIIYSDQNVSLTYESKDEKFVYFEYGEAEGTQLSIDNETHNYYEINRNNDRVYYFYETVEDNGMNVLVWYEDGYYYSISAQISADGLVKIAENVE